MRLYKRDYTKLTPKERREWNAEKRKIKKNEDEFGSIDARFFLTLKFPKAAQHYKSLFPNNYLDPRELKRLRKLKRIRDDFEKLVSKKSTTERQILNFIKKREAYFIIGSILEHYFFGHHATYLFREFEIPPNYKADFLIIGKSSMGHEFIFVELENPYLNITTGDGSFGKTIRKGYKQVEDWDKLLESNFSSLRLVFDKYKGGPKVELPREFIDYDKTRVHYVIVAGRRKDFNERTYRNRRKGKGNNVLVLHYDNLIDSGSRIIGNDTY
jgi:hypothetical protein